MASPNLQDVHDTLINIARKAGEMITSAHPSTGGSGIKKNSADLVTETDKAVEDMVSSTLKEKYPDYEFIGEETYRPGLPLTDAPTFIVDPIDGTTNFVHSFPYACISLGFTIARRPVVGVVYNPFTDTLYTAISGHGAFKTSSAFRSSSPSPSTSSNSSSPSPNPNRHRLPLRSEPLTHLNQALIALEWGSDRSGHNYKLKVDTFRSLCADESEGGAMVHSARSLGSAALNMCGVAEGGLDAYWEGGCYAWDVAAGWCILLEAGGMVVDGNSGTWEIDVMKRTYLAVRAGAGKEFVEQFWSHIKGDMVYEH